MYEIAVETKYMLWYMILSMQKVAYNPWVLILHMWKFQKNIQQYSVREIKLEQKPSIHYRTVNVFP